MGTKKERQRIATLEHDLALAKALRWTEPVERDVPIPQWHADDNSGIVNGWDFNDYFGGPRVEKACTSCVSHDFGQWDKTTTQQPINLYSTRLLALRALRHSMEGKCAELLAKIDKQIQEEVGDGR